MTNSHERIGKYVKQESADKLLGRYSHLLALITIATVSVPEGDKTILDFHDAVVGNGNAMRISAEIIKHLVRTVERCLGIHNPIFFPDLVDCTSSAINL